MRAGASPGARLKELDPRIPDGDPATAWDRRRAEYKLVSPLNAKKFTVVVVGTGLAGSGAAAALGELGDALPGVGAAGRPEIEPGLAAVDAVARGLDGRQQFAEQAGDAAH